MSSQRKIDYFPFKGGINSEDPAISIPPGELIDAYNYECATRGGYRRISGYERYDGHHLASASTYYTVNFSNGVHEPQVGETVVGGTSGAVGVILAVVVDSGSWATSDAVGHIVIHIESGSFVSGELISVYSPVAFSDGFGSGFL